MNSSEKKILEFSKNSGGKNPTEVTSLVIELRENLLKLAEENPDIRVGNLGTILDEIKKINTDTEESAISNKIKHMCRLIELEAIRIKSSGC